MTKSITLSLGIISMSLLSYAQNETDVLRYSQTHFGGTSRYNSMAGAFGALGGDISTLSTNPAGIAVYRKSEITFTPSVYFSYSSADHLGTTSEDDKGNFNIGNLGYVGTNEVSGGGWVSTHFAIAHNRLNNYHTRTTIRGINPNSSLLDTYLNQVNAGGGVTWENIPDPFGAQLAWQTFLLDTLPGGVNYVAPIGEQGVDQHAILTTRGFAGETLFAFGANYNNRLYLGASIGITSIRYDRELRYQESSIPGDSTTFLDNFVYNEELRTRGNGYTFKIGFIYRATDFLRLGGAVHTPTYYDLQDEWATDITANFNDGFSETALSPIGEFDYAITSPFRAQGSIAYIIGKQGLISAEYEFIDYASARLRSDDANFDVANDVVRNGYRATGNLKIGGEWRLKPFALRAGFAHFGSPYDDSANNDGSLRSYTFGAGYRQSEFFIDLAYVYTRKEENLFLYDPSLIESSNITYTNHNVQLTVGIRL